MVLHGIAARELGGGRIQIDADDLTAGLRGLDGKRCDATEQVDDTFTRSQQARQARAFIGKAGREVCLRRVDMQAHAVLHHLRRAVAAACDACQITRAELADDAAIMERRSAAQEPHEGLPDGGPVRRQRLRYLDDGDVAKHIESTRCDVLDLLGQQ